jgi:hypothetical protein
MQADHSAAAIRERPPPRSEGAADAETSSGAEVDWPSSNSENAQQAQLETIGHIPDDFDDIKFPVKYSGLPLIAFDDAGTLRRDEVIDGLLAIGETSLLIAPPFGGKSALAVHIAAYVSSGREWFGRRISKPGPVLYVAGERAMETARRLAVLNAERRLACVVANGSSLDLRRQDAVRRLRDTAAEVSRLHGIPPTLLVFDTLASLTSGADENSASDMTKAMAAIASIRDELRAHALVVHHTPRGDNRQVRGHSAIDGAADLIIGIDQTKGHSRRWIVRQANSLAPPFPAGVFEIVSHAGSQVAVVRAVDHAHSLTDRQLAVMTTLRLVGSEGMIIAKLTKQIDDPAFADTDSDAKRKAVIRAISDLVTAGYAVIEGEGRHRIVRPRST